MNGLSKSKADSSICESMFLFQLHVRLMQTKFKSEIIEDPFSKVEGALVNYVESENGGFVVMGTKGRSGYRRMLIGSVVSAVLSYGDGLQCQ